MSTPETQQAGLVEQLKACLDADERIAQAACGGGEGRWSRENGRGTRNLRDEQLTVVVYDEGSPSDEEFDHIARHDPKRILAMVAAHREILELHTAAGQLPATAGGWYYCTTCGSGEAYEYPTEWPCQTIKSLAKGYGIEES